MPLVDTHCHLDDPQYGGEVEAVLERARLAGVAAMVSIGTSRESSETAAALAAAHPTVWAAVGCHPHEADHAVEAGVTDWLVELAHRPRVVAIGETGLDRFKKYAEPARQRRLFLQHIDAARRTGLPIVIHCREAHREVREILRAEMRAPIRGVVHCFSGTPEDLDGYVELGLVISLAGPVTFPNAPKLRAVAERVPLDRLVVETDAPYLAPQAVRGRRNEPAYVRFTAEFLAALRGVDGAEFEERTTRTAQALFGLAEVATEGRRV